MMPRCYSSATAFRTALEARLIKIAGIEGVQVNRLRRQVAFDRLLARLFHRGPAPWYLKGGYAMELRYSMARATIDIDLTVERRLMPEGVAATLDLREVLQEAAGVALGDWFEYAIGAPILDLDAAPYGGARYPVEARMDGRVFARFHLDAGVGDAVIEPADPIDCRDWLDFAGIAPARVRLISPEQQFAEKLHAYTLPRPAVNSRVKDLVDMALLINSGGLNPARTLEALRLTFRRRSSHVLPENLSAPPPGWQGPFATLAKECALAGDLEAVFDIVNAFFNGLAHRASR